MLCVDFLLVRRGLGDRSGAGLGDRPDALAGPDHRVERWYDAPSGSKE
jgi:hypothetical protein